MATRKSLNILLEYDRKKATQDLEQLLKDLQKNTPIKINIDTNSIDGSLKGLTDTLNNITKQMQNAFNTSQYIKNQASQVDNVTTSYEKQAEVISKLENEKSKSSTYKLKSDGTQELIKDVTTLNTGLGRTETITQNVASKLTTMTEKVDFSKLENTISSMQSKLTQSGKNGFIDESVITNLQSKLNSINTNTPEKEIKELQGVINNLSGSDSQIVKVQSAISKMEFGLEGMKGKYGGLVGDSSSISQLQKYESELNNLKKTLTQLKSGNSFSGAKLTSELNSASNSSRELKLAVTNSANALRLAQRDAVSFGGAIKQAFQNTGLYISTAMAVRQLGQAFKEATTYIQTMDKALTNIQMITGQSKDKVQQSVNDFKELGKQMHTTNTEIVAGAEETMRAGYGNDDSQKVLSASIMGSKISGQDMKTTTSQLIAVKNAFDLTGDSMERVVDIISKADNTSATSFAEIAEAIQRTAFSAQEAGTPLDNLVSYITTVSEKTRKSAETIGESFKTVYARYSNIKLGNLDEDGKSINDTEKAMARIGIQIRDGKDKFREFDTVLQEFMDKYKSGQLSQVDYLAGVQALAGTRQRETLMALMENTDDLAKHQRDLADATGSAKEMFNKAYSNSLDAKINDLKRSFEGFYEQILSSDILKSGITLLSGLIDTFGNLPSILALVTTAFLTFKGEALLGFIVTLGKAISNVGLFKVAMGELDLVLSANPLGLLAVAITAVVGGFIALSNNGKKAQEDLKKFNDEVGKTNSELQKTINSSQDYVKKIEDLNKAISNTDSEEKKKKLTDELTQAQKDLATALPDATTDISDDGTNMATSIEYTKEIITLKKEEMKINAQKFFDENKGLASEIDELEKKKAKLKEYQIALAEGKTSVKQNFDTVENGRTVSKAYDVKISSDDVKKLNDEILNTTKTAEQAKVMSKYLGDDVTDDQKRMIQGVDEYTNKLKQNTQEKQNNAKTKTNIESNTPASVDNINLFSGAIKELNNTSSLSEQSVKKLSEALPNLDLSNMSAKEKVEALTKALQDQKDAMDADSKKIEKQGQKDYVSQLENMDKVNKYLEEMQKNGMMSIDVMKELANNELFSDFTGDINNMAQVQDYFNSKLISMKDIANNSYQVMMGNSQAYYKNQLNNGSNLQKAYNEWASHYVDVNNSSYAWDSSNYNTLNSAKSGMLQNMSSVMSNYLANLVGGSAEAYKKDLDSCKTWGDMKTRVLEKLDAQLANLNANFATGSSIMAEATRLESFGLDTPQQQAMLEKTKQLQGQIQQQIQNLMNNRRKIEADFNSINMGDSGWNPPSKPTEPYKGTEYKGGDSGKSGKDAEKTINYLKEEYDRYLDLINARDKLNDAIAKNESLAENKTGQEKINILKQQVDLYNQLRTANINLRNAEQSRLNELKNALIKQGFGFNGNDLVNSQARLKQLEDMYNSKMTADNQEQMKDAYQNIKKLTDEYLKLVNNEIPNATKEIIDMDNKIYSQYKSIADEVKKQRDEFIKAEEEKTEATKKEIEKRKKALQDAKEKEDEDDELSTKQKSIDDLQNKLSIALKTGDAELIKTAKENLANAQEELDKYTRDKDYDKSIKRLEEESTYVEESSKSKIDNINKQLSDDKILELVQKGVTDIGGVLNGLKSSVTELPQSFVSVANTIDASIIPSLMKANSLVSNLKAGIGFNADIRTSSVASKSSSPISIVNQFGDININAENGEDLKDKFMDIVEEHDKKLMKILKDNLET